MDDLRNTICAMATRVRKELNERGETGVGVLEEYIPQVYLTLVRRIQEMSSDFQENKKPPILTKHEMKGVINSVIGPELRYPNDFAEATLFLQERGEGARLPSRGTALWVPEVISLLEPRPQPPPPAIPTPSFRERENLLNPG